MSKFVVNWKNVASAHVRAEGNLWDELKSHVETVEGLRVFLVYGTEEDNVGMRVARITGSDEHMDSIKNLNSVYGDPTEEFQKLMRQTSASTAV